MRRAKRRFQDNPAHREYARLAPHCDERWSFYIRRSAGETLRRTGPHSPDTVLDVGCGIDRLRGMMTAEARKSARDLLRCALHKAKSV